MFLVVNRFLAENELLRRGSGRNHVKRRLAFGGITAPP
jgi:hypothetical protein